jgi:hypothetical protein
MITDERIHPRRVTFDMTINLGHIITLVSMLIAGVGMWMMMDKRVTILEVYSNTQRANDARQDSDLLDTKKIVRDDLKDIGQKLDRLIERSGK